MSSAVLVTVGRRQARTARRVLPAVVSRGYKLFGANIGVRRMLLPEKMPAAKQWFIDRCLKGPRLSWRTLWDMFQDQHDSWFAKYWRVRLYDASRDLGPGDYIFQPIQNFSRIPGSPGSHIDEAFMNAYCELPAATKFFYLDLVWEREPGGVQKLLTPRILHRRYLEQFVEIRDFVNHWLWFFQARRFCMNRLEEALWLTDIALMPTRPILRWMLEEKVRYQLHSSGARRIEVSNTASATDLMASLFVSSEDLKANKIVTWDPAIVFEDHNFRPPGFGGVPLGLVAHWD